MKPGGLLQPLNILDWKWEDISMNFIMGVPLIARKFVSKWVIVDRFIKSVNFIPMDTNYSVKRYAKLYIVRILCLHGVPKTTVSKRRYQFVARFLEQLHAPLGTHLIHSLAYHPQTDDQTKKVNQILDDMLGACVMDHQCSWDQCLSLAEFSYNNSY
jgi:hypothetical protein